MTFRKVFLLSLIISIGLFLAFSVQAQAQTQQPSTASTASTAKKEVAQPTADQKKLLKDAADTFQKAQQTADSARDKFNIVLLATMAELGLKPSETGITWDKDGLPVFTHVDPQVAQKSEEKKKEDNKNAKAP